MYPRVDFPGRIIRSKYDKAKPDIAATARPLVDVSDDGAEPWTPGVAIDFPFGKSDFEIILTAWDLYMLLDLIPEIDQFGNPVCCPDCTHLDRHDRLRAAGFTQADLDRMCGGPS